MIHRFFVRSIFVLPALWLILASSPARAVVPDAINYQGIARRPDGAPIGSQPVKIRATVHRSTAVGVIVYQETHMLMTTAGGQFSIKIGQGTPVVATFANILWPSFSHYLQIEIDPAGGNAFVDMGTQQFVSVPYAQHADTAETTVAVQGTAGRVPVFAGAGNTLANSVITQSGSFIGINDSSPAYTLDVNGTVRGTIDVISGGDVTAAGNIIASGSAAISGNITVAAGRGIVRSQNSTQLKLVRNTVSFTLTGLASNSFVDSGALNYEDFGGVPTVTMGACTTQNGEWYKITITPINVTSSQCQFRLFNPASDAVTFTGATWQVLVVGPQ
jgi:hypothetical protein